MSVGCHIVKGPSSFRGVEQARGGNQVRCGPVSVSICSRFLLGFRTGSRNISLGVGGRGMGRYTGSGAVRGRHRVLWRRSWPLEGSWWLRRGVCHAMRPEPGRVVRLCRAGIPDCRPHLGQRSALLVFLGPLVERRKPCRPRRCPCRLLER